MPAPFNPFTWDNANPVAGQNISNGQVTILNDINFLGSTFGLPASSVPGVGFIQFPNGFIFQWIFINSISAGNNTINFAAAGGTAFPAHLFAAWAQPVSTHASYTIQVLPNSSVTFNNTQCGLDASNTTSCFLFLIGN